jgi:thiosulfate/3-mercaptopyruvate sulfurtransferase
LPHVKNYDGSWTEYGSVVGVPIDNPSAARQPVPA